MRRWAIAAAAYSGLAIAMTWPLAARLSSVLPHDAYDPSLVTWILWWNAHTPPLTDAWWNAPFFWPMHGALSLSEHLLGISILTTPLQWLGLTPVASYNVAFIASFPLAALAFHALAFALTTRHDAAAVGAVAFAFGPYRIAQMAHLQMLWTFGVPLALLALHRHAETRQVRWLVLFAIAWALQALSNGYLLLFLPVLIATWIAWHVREARHLAAIGVAWLAGSLPLLPIVVQYEHWQIALALRRRYEEIQAFSADVLSIVSAAPEAGPWGHILRPTHVEDQFFPGAVVLLLVGAGMTSMRRAPGAPPGGFVRAVRRLSLCGALAAAAAALSAIVFRPWTLSAGGLVTLVSVSAPQKPLTVALLFSAIYGLSSPEVVSAWRRRSAFAFYLIAAAVTFLCALGPLPQFNGRPLLFHTLYWWLLQLPGFSRARVPARFGMLFELCLAVAGSLAFARLTVSRPDRRRIGAAAIAIAAMAVEGWPRLDMAALPAPLAIPSDRRERVALLELPLGAVEADTAALWRSMQHRLPLVNGYSGYAPVHYEVLRLGLESGDARVLDPLARDRDLIVAIGEPQHARWSALVAGHQRASRVAEDSWWDLYRIRQAPAPAAIASLRPLSIAAVRTADHPENAGMLIDGTAETTWSSGKPQAGHEYVEIDFGRDAAPAAVKVAFGAVFSDFPRTLEVDCATHGDDWRPCWSGSAAALLLEGALADPGNPTMTIAIDVDRVRQIRLRQTGIDPVHQWSMAEVSAFTK